MYTIKRLSYYHKEKVKEHFFRLDSQSRHSRFCSAMNNENLVNYVSKIDFINNGVFGLFNDNLDIIGLGECVISKSNDNSIREAEVAFSVEKPYQGQKLGNRLMKRVVQFANIQNLKELTMYFLKDNAATMHLAKKYNFKVEYYSLEVSGKVQVPNIPPILDSFSTQIEEIFANIELTQKLQHKLTVAQFNALDKHIKNFTI